MQLFSCEKKSLKMYLQNGGHCVPTSMFYQEIQKSVLFYPKLNHNEINFVFGFVIIKAFDHFDNDCMRFSVIVNQQLMAKSSCAKNIVQMWPKIFAVGYCLPYFQSVSELNKCHSLIACGIIMLYDLWWKGTSLCYSANGIMIYLSVFSYIHLFFSLYHDISISYCGSKSYFLAQNTRIIILYSSSLNDAFMIH